MRLKSLLLNAVLLSAAGIAPCRAELSRELQGALLISEHNCTACHERGEADWMLGPRGAPALETAASRILPEHLTAFLADPEGTKPGTRMPHLLASLPEAARAEAAAALTHYLVSLDPNPPKAEPLDAEAIGRGRLLYHQVGCVACHDPEGKELGDSAPLGPLAQKYSLASLTAFLEDPLKVRPSGLMPDLGLGHYEARDIASFLIGKPPGKADDFVLDQELVVQGKELFARHNCMQCHSSDTRTLPPLASGDGTALPGQAPPKSAAKPLAELDPSKGCLSGEQGAWPRYALDETEVEAIRSTLRELPVITSKPMRIQATLHRFNCIACHQRDDYGGISAERLDFFTSSNLNLGEQASKPPTLTGVGAKMKPETLRKILALGPEASARPYMRTLMPKFGADNLGDLHLQFGAVDSLPRIEFEPVREEKVARQTGAELVGVKGLGCVACHTWDGKSATTLQALDLTVMSKRVQENWFHHYLRDPQRFHPQTIMPSYWPGGKSVRPETLDGNAGKQIDAIWQYLSRGRQGRPPNGLKREPLPIVVENETVMLRRSYPGIGKRGIGVGYPGGVNIAFDAGQMRLGSLWWGEFVEASSVWRGQGAGNVRELSREVTRFPVGPAFAILETESTPWPEDEAKKAEGFAFRGYTLDDKRRPTFRYSFAGASFLDRFVERADGRDRVALVRSITWSRSPEAAGEIYFRIAAAREIKALEDNSYQIGKWLRLKAPPQTILRQAPEGAELILAIHGLGDDAIEYHRIDTP